MRVIFLDIDGVLVTRAEIMVASGMRATAKASCVAVLNRITDVTGAVIVVSSSWRYGGEQWMREKLIEWGVRAEMIGITPVRWKVDRGREIQAWIATAGPVDAIVILDDDSDMAHLLSRLVKTEMVNGLTEAHAERAITLLTERAR